MNEDALKLLTVTVGALFLLMACNSTQPVVTEDIPHGNCVGKITDQNGTPVAGASVVLVPEGFVAMSSGSGSGVPDSTISNAAGYYGLNVETSGKYNLLANDNRNYVLRRAIPVNAGTQLDLPDEKLIPPGSLSGSVHLDAKEDHQSAVILFTGTNTFISPSDASGDFSVARLAEGSYDLRILSTESDFAEVETTVTVVSGELTTLPPITLARKQVPVIDEFSAEYDPYMMKVSLSWKTSDFDIIDSINLYCNREQNIKPVVTFDGSVAAYTIDLIMDTIMSHTYQIAAVGKDGWEVESVHGESFINNSVIRDTTLEMPEETAGAIATTTTLYHFNENGVYYFKRDHMASEYQIFKMNQDLVFEKSGSFHGELFVLCENAVSDGDGNLYFMARVDDLSDAITSTKECIVKIDRDLNLVERHPVAGSYGPQTLSMAVSSNGAIILFHANGRILHEPDTGDTTFVTVYSPDFTIISETFFTDVRQIRQSAVSNDSVVTVIACNAWEHQKIVYFDESFNEIGFADPLSELKNSAPESDSWIGGIAICSSNLFVGGYKTIGIQSVLVFFNSKNEAIARYPYSHFLYDDITEVIMRRGLFSNTNGYLYAFENAIERYSIDKIIEMAEQ